MTAGALFAVTVVGRDRPGIVAGVTRTLYDQGCNLEDVTSTILRGHFSMVMIVQAPEGLGLEDLASALDETATALDVSVSVNEVTDAHGDAVTPTHIVSVHGADKPGIVFRVASALARHGANITDLTSRVLGGDDDPVYAVMLEVALTEGAEDDLRALTDELDVHVSVNRLETDVL